MKRRVLVALALAVAVGVGVVVLAGGGSENRPKRYTIDIGRASGHRARATAEGIARRPTAVAIRASAAPKQPVRVIWGLSCPKVAGGQDKGTGGTYVTTPPDSRPLELPQREIAFCAVRAQVRLAHSGRAKVTLVAAR